MDKIITRLQHLLHEVPRRLQQFSSSEMAARPAVGRWSKREILGHLCDSALHNWQRFNLAQLTEEPLQIARYQQDILVALNNWQAQPTAQVVALWVALNTQIVEVLKHWPPGETRSKILRQSIVLPDGTAATLQFLVEDYLVHLEHHLVQIFAKKIEQPSLPGRWSSSAEAALELLRNNPDGQPFLTILEHGRMSVEVYQPKRIDLQQPHSQPEIYVVIRGSGTFFINGDPNGACRRPFGPGDMLFVPAGVEHRFEDFTDDFATWVIFY